MAARADVHQHREQERNPVFFPFVSELLRKCWEKIWKEAHQIYPAVPESAPARLCRHIMELKRTKSYFHTESLLALCSPTVEWNFISAGGEAGTGAEHRLFVFVADASRGESDMFLVHKAATE